MDLPKKFKKYGDLFIHVTNSNGWYVYQRIPYMDDDGFMVSGTKSHFEVVKPLWREASPYKEKKWRYPSDSDWGKAGFTVGTIEKAMDKVRELNNA